MPESKSVHILYMEDDVGLARLFQKKLELPPTIMTTGAGNEHIAVEAMKLGVCDYIVKDVGGGHLDLLPSVIEQVLQQLECKCSRPKMRQQG